MKYLKAIKVQLLVIGVILILKGFMYFGIIPEEEILAQILTELLSEKGLIILLLLSFGENLAGFNIYFPGSIAILFGMANTKGDIGLALLTFLTIFSGALLANLINVCIGYKWKPEKTSNRIDYKLMFSTLWHPHLTSLTSLKIGNSKNPSKSFIKYFLPVSLLWNIFWAITMYTIGTTSSSSLKLFVYIFYAYLVIWILQDLRKEKSLSLTLDKK